jgi:hypothetical protein
MARKATIIGVVMDAWGDAWDVREFRPTDHGFAVAIGWPSGFPRGRGGVGGPRVILTRELVEHLESVRHALTPMSAARLPLGRPQVKRLRRLLGHDRKADRHEWWMARADDLVSLTSREFAGKHGCDPDAAENFRRAHFGPSREVREPGWYLSPEHRDVILSRLPAAHIADELGVSVAYVYDLRSKIKRAES